MRVAYLEDEFRLYRKGGLMRRRYVMDMDMEGGNSEIFVY